MGQKKDTNPIPLVSGILIGHARDLCKCKTCGHVGSKSRTFHQERFVSTQYSTSSNGPLSCGGPLPTPRPPAANLRAIATFVDLPAPEEASQESETFQGNQLVFCGLYDADDHRKHQLTYRHVLGQCVVHCGKQRHGAVDIEEGERVPGPSPVRGMYTAPKNPLRVEDKRLLFPSNK